jgi:hypothetical protein
MSVRFGEFWGVPAGFKPSLKLGVNGQFVTHAFSGNVDWVINKYVFLGLS